MKITRTGPTPDASKRAFLDAAKAALLTAVEAWHSRYLPRHFTVAGGKLYGYQPRKGEGEPAWVPATGGLLRGGKVQNKLGQRLVRNKKYFWTKWNKYKTHDPLVFTGTSKAAALQSIRLSARAVNGEGVLRGTGVLDVPRYFYQYDLTHGAPDKADEVTRTTPAEEQDLAAVYERDLAARLANARAPATQQKIA